MSVSLLTWWGGALASCAGFVLLSPMVARRAPARLASWTLSLGSLVLAAVSVALPLVLFVALFGQWGPVAAMGHWSAHLVRDRVSVPVAVLALGTVVLAGQGLLLVRTAWREGQALSDAWRLARRSAGALVVLPDERPTVFALPGWPGRIVAAQQLLQALNPSEIRVVLAHEQAHLDGRHELHRAAVSLASALNPMLRPARGAISLATERWADERAAMVVGDRALVARTIGHVAQVCGREIPVSPSMAAAGPGVALRVEALLAPPLGRRVLLTATLAVLALVPAGAAVHALGQTNDLFQRAERAYGTSAPVTTPLTSISTKASEHP